MPRVMVLVVCLFALIAAPAAARHIRSGEIQVGRGAAGVQLGMARSDVVARFGRPFFENDNGYMQYAPDGASNIFDVYLDEPGEPGHVTQMIVAGGHFHIGRIHVFERGAVGRLLRRYEGRIRRTFIEGSGDPIYRVRVRSLGRLRFTDFMVTRHSRRAMITNVIIYFAH